LESAWFGIMNIDWQFLSDLFSIVMINLILSGDNAVVIAMAVRSLPREEKKRGIIFGAGAAVGLRIILTFFVAQLLQIIFIKLLGGVLILWIAVKLFVDGSPGDEVEKKAATLAQAMRMIVMADITMSIDNMLAVAAASHGNLFLLIFGLGMSIPFVLFTSNLLSMLMDRYPIIILVGAAILGKVGGEMIMTDPFVVNLLGTHEILLYAVETILAVGVIVVGKLWMKWVKKRGNSGRRVRRNRQVCLL
jgi:YjbE family integral membrane protein